MVNSANKANSNANASAGKDGAKQAKRDTSMTSAFNTLKSNAKILSQETPEPGALEVVFINNQEEAKETLNDTDDSKPDQESKFEDPKAEEAEATDKPAEKEYASEVKQSESNVASEPEPASDVAISKEVASKLRKFKKYEEKYPGK